MVCKQLKNPEVRLFKKVQMRGARRSMSGGVLLYVDAKSIERNEPRWAFFNSLLFFVEPFDKPARFDLPRDLVRDELLRIGVLRRGRGA